MKRTTGGNMMDLPPFAQGESREAGKTAYP